MKRILSGVGEKSWFEVMAQRIAAGAVATDVEGRIVYINHAAERLLEPPPRALLSRRCAEVAGCRATGSSSNHADACPVAENGEGYAFIVSVCLGCQDAEADLMASPVFDEQNERLGWLCHLDDAGSRAEDQFEKAKAEFLSNVGCQRLLLRSAFPWIRFPTNFVKSIVELRGGQVGLKSVPGEGSTFWFSLSTAIG